MNEWSTAFSGRRKVELACIVGQVDDSTWFSMGLLTDCGLNFKVYRLGTGSQPLLRNERTNERTGPADNR